MNPSGGIINGSSTTEARGLATIEGQMQIANLEQTLKSIAAASLG
jgi:hypothetical protein